jgi:hypothetical protein
LKFAAGSHDQREQAMKLHAPKETIFWVAVTLLFLALFGHFVPDMGFLNQYYFWLAVASAAVLIVGCVT